MWYENPSIYGYDCKLANKHFHAIFDGGDVEPLENVISVFKAGKAGLVYK
jgi:hypothetical protein